MCCNIPKTFLCSFPTTFPNNFLFYVICFSRVIILSSHQIFCRKQKSKIYTSFFLLWDCLYKKMQNEKTHSHTFVWCSMKETKWKLKFIVSNVVLWPKYINANGKRCGCRFRVEDKTPFFFHLYIYSNLSFLNSSISRWFLNTFFDLSTNQPRKKSRRTKSFFSPLRWSMQKRTFNCLLYHSFFSSLFFLPLFNL